MENQVNSSEDFRRHLLEQEFVGHYTPTPVANELDEKIRAQTRTFDPRLLTAYSPYIKNEEWGKESVRSGVEPTHAARIIAAAYIVQVLGPGSLYPTEVERQNAMAFMPGHNYMPPRFSKRMDTESTNFVELIQELRTAPRRQLTEWELHVLYRLDEFQSQLLLSGVRAEERTELRSIRDSQDIIPLAACLPSIFQGQLEEAYTHYEYMMHTAMQANQSLWRHMQQGMQGLFRGKFMPISKDTLHSSWMSQDSAWHDDGTYQRLATRIAQTGTRYQLRVGHRRTKLGIEPTFKLISSETNEYAMLWLEYTRRRQPN